MPNTGLNTTGLGKGGQGRSPGSLGGAEGRGNGIHTGNLYVDHLSSMYCLLTGSQNSLGCLWGVISFFPQNASGPGKADPRPGKEPLGAGVTVAGPYPLEKWGQKSRAPSLGQDVAWRTLAAQPFIDLVPVREECSGRARVQTPRPALQPSPLGQGSRSKAPAL